MVADPAAETVIGGGAAELFDPLVFIEGGDALAGRLAADPVAGFGEDDRAAPFGGALGGSAAAQSAAGDKDVAMQGLHWVSFYSASG